MIDLLYFEDSSEYSRIKDEVEEQFPQAEFEDASDDVHPARLEVTFPDDQETAYLEWLLSKRYSECSLTWGMMMYQSPGRALEMLNRVKMAEALSKMA